MIILSSIAIMKLFVLNVVSDCSFSSGESSDSPNKTRVVSMKKHKIKGLCRRTLCAVLSALFIFSGVFHSYQITVEASAVTATMSLFESLLVMLGVNIGIGQQASWWQNNKFLWEVKTACKNGGTVDYPNYGTVDFSDSESIQKFLNWARTNLDNFDHSDASVMSSVMEALNTVSKKKTGTSAIKALSSYSNVNGTSALKDDVKDTFTVIEGGNTGSNKNNKFNNDKFKLFAAIMAGSILGFGDQALKNKDKLSTGTGEAVNTQEAIGKYADDSEALKDCPDEFVGKHFVYNGKYPIVNGKPCVLRLRVASTGKFVYCCLADDSLLGRIACWDDSGCHAFRFYACVSYNNDYQVWNYSGDLYKYFEFYVYNVASDSFIYSHRSSNFDVSGYDSIYAYLPVFSTEKNTKAYIEAVRFNLNAYGTYYKYDSFVDDPDYTDLGSMTNISSFENYLDTEPSVDDLKNMINEVVENTESAENSTTYPDVYQQIINNYYTTNNTTNNPAVETKDYTSLLEQIVEGIKSLPDSIAAALADHGLGDGSGTSSGDDENNKFEADSVSFLNAFLLLIYILFMLLKIFLHLLEFIINVFKIPASPGFITGDFATGFNYIRSVELSGFGCSVYEFFMTLIHISIIFGIVKMMKKHIDSIKG